MPVTTTTLGDLLKRVYGKHIVQQVNKAAYIYKEFPKSPYSPKGTGYYFAASVAGNQAGGFVNESEAFRTPQNETVVQMVVIPKIFNWPVQITGLAIAASEGDEAAFATGLIRQLDEALENSLKDLNRTSYGRGTGRLGVVNGAQTAATTVLVDDTLYLKQNMIVDVYTTAGAREVDSATISSVNRLANTVTFSAAVTVSDRSEIVREETRVSAASDGKEMAGLEYIVDDGTVSATFQGQSRTTYPILRGNIIAAGAVNLTNDLLQRAADEVSYVGDGRIDWLISRHGQRRKYLDINIADKRFTDDRLDRGWQTLNWNGIEWIVDVDCPRKVIYLLTKRYINRYEIKGIHLDDTNNAILKWTGSGDNFLCYYKGYLNLGSEKPNAHARIDNLAEPAGAL